MKKIVRYSRFVFPYLPRRILFIFTDVLAGIFLRHKRASMKEALKGLLGEIPKKDLNRIAIKATKYKVRDSFEFLTFQKFSWSKLNKTVYFEGLNYLYTALQAGKGVLLCQAHFGFYKMIPIALANLNYKVNQVANYTDKDLAYIEFALETRFHLRFIYVNSENYTVRIQKALSKAEIVGLLLDSSFGTQLFKHPFLNSQIWISNAGAALSLISGSPSIPVFTLREGLKRHRIIFHEPFDLDRRIGRKEYIMQWTGQYVQLLESYVKKYPDHYAQWFLIQNNQSIFPDTH